MVFYNLFTFMSDQRAVDDVRALVIKLLEDEQLEVKKKKKKTRSDHLESPEVIGSETGPLASVYASGHFLVPL